jgi:hypothetical protein
MLYLKNIKANDSIARTSPESYKVSLFSLLAAGKVCNGPSTTLNNNKMLQKTTRTHKRVFRSGSKKILPTLKATVN